MKINVQGIKEYRDRHGKLRRYYRRKGAPSVAISTDLTGAALAAEVDRLDKLYKPMAPLAGTLRVLVADYKDRSAHWRGLRDRTQKDYERVFSWLGSALDHKLIGIKPTGIVKLRDKAAAAHGFKFANQLLIVLSKVCAFGVEYGHLDSNPAAEISSVARPKDLPEANRPWTTEEALELLRAPIYLAGPIAMAAYLGLREGDVLRMSSATISQRLLSITTSKTRRALELPVCDDLWSILLRYQKWRSAFWDDKRAKAEAEKSREVVQDLVTTMFVNSRGKAWTSDGFRTSWGKWRDQLVEEGKIGRGVTFHGGRHTVATILAECGFEAQQVKHLLGHGSETMTEHYQRRAKRRGMLKEMTEAVQGAYRQAGQETVIGLDTFTICSGEKSGN